MGGIDDASYKVKLGQWNGSIAEVWVNGEKAGLVAWKPYEIDVTGLLKEGDNEIVVKVIGSLKSTFGFFYNKNDSWIFGPHSWNRGPDNIPQEAEYYLMHYGLIEPFTVVRVCNPNLY